MTSKQVQLLNKKSEEMSLEEWVNYMSDSDILIYNLNNIKFPIPKNNSLFPSIKNSYKTFEDFFNFLKKSFSKQWLNNRKKIFKKFYFNIQDLKIGQWWLDSELHLQIIGKSYHKKITKQQLIYYIRRGYNLLQSRILLHSQCKELTPRRKEFWLKKGFSEEEAEIKVMERTAYNSKFTKEYWIRNGYNEQQAIIEAKKFQEKYNFTNPKFYKYNGLDSDEIKSIIKNKCQKNSYISYLHWMEKGYSYEEAKDIARKCHLEFSANTNPYGGKYAKLLYEKLEERIKNSNLKFKNICYGYKNFEKRIDIANTSNKILIKHFKSSGILLDFYVEIEDYKFDIEYDAKNLHNPITDQLRDEYLKSLGFHIIRVSDRDLNINKIKKINILLDKLILKIKEYINENR